MAVFVGQRLSDWLRLELLDQSKVFHSPRWMFHKEEWPVGRGRKGRERNEGEGEGGGGGREEKGVRRGERWRSERERDQTEGGKQRQLKLDGTYSCKQSLKRQYGGQELVVTRVRTYVLLTCTSLLH